MSSAGGIDAAIADAYRALSLAGADMRRVAELLESFRQESSGGDPAALDRIDDLIAIAGADAMTAALAAAADRALIDRAAEQTDDVWDERILVLARAVAALRSDHAHRLWTALCDRLGELPAALQATLGLDRAGLALGLARVQAARWGGCGPLFRGLAAAVSDPRRRGLLLVHAAAVALYFHGRPARARALIDQAAALAPSLSRVRSAQGNLAVEAGDLAGGEELYRQALKLAAGERASERADALSNLGDVEARRGRTREALVSYDDALRASPGAVAPMTSVIALAGSPASYEGLRARIGELVLRARGLDGAAAVRATLMAGDAAWRAEVQADADRWNGELARLPGGGALAVQQRGQWSSAAGRLDEARAAFAEAVALEPDLADGWRQLAETCLAQGDVEGARAALARMTAIDPDAFAAVTLPGAIAAAAGDVAAARAVLEAALAEEPAGAATAALIEQLARRFDGPNEAWLRERLAAAGKLDSAAGWWNQEGNRRWQDRAAAVDAYRKAAWYQPSALVHCNLALALTDLRRFDEAGAELDRAAPLAATDDDRRREHELRARIENEAGNDAIDRDQLAVAIARYRASLELDPDDAVVWSNLASAHERAAASGDPVAALEQARVALGKALALRPGHDPDRARMIQLEAKLSLLTTFGQRALGVPVPAAPLTVELAADVLPAFVDDHEQLRPPVTAALAAFRRAVEERHGVKLPGVTFRVGELPAGSLTVTVRGTPSVYQPTGDDPVAALAAALALFAGGGVAELVGHDTVARALADARVTLPPDRQALTAATSVARAFVEEQVALAPVAPWAEAVLAAWAARPPSLIALVEQVRAAAGVRGRLAANQPGVATLVLDEAVGGTLADAVTAAGELARLPLAALEPALGWIRAQAEAAGGPIAVIVPAGWRFMLARAISVSGAGGAIAITTAGELETPP